MSWVTNAHGFGRVALLAMTIAGLFVALNSRVDAHGGGVDAIYATTEMRQDQIGVRLGVVEQFTYSGTLKRNGEPAPNPNGERLSSSVTQILGGYNITPRMGVQVNLPVIARDYRRVVTDGIESGDPAGIGDMSLLFIAKPVSYSRAQLVAHAIGFAGIKVPTGSPAFLSGEAPKPPCIPWPDPNSCTRRTVLQRQLPLPPRLHPRHSTGPPSGIHGHDLTLGSGSVDGIIGTELFGSWRRLFGTAAVQYLMRSVGAYGYEFANDLLFAAGPGYYPFTGESLRGTAYSFRAQLLLSGETKGVDSVEGNRVGDTAMTAVYLGPLVGFDWGKHLGSELFVELPVLQNNSGLQAVPDYRLNVALTWRF